MKFFSPRFTFVVFLVLIVVFTSSGCAGFRAGRSGGSPPSHITPSPLASSRIVGAGWTPGAYHTVQKGQTLWSLSQMYGIPIDDILAKNDIPDINDIKVGTLLWIPHIKIRMQEIPLYDDRGKWKYIVVHHTATSVGDAATIGASHQKRGFKSMGYHFLIDNGTRGKANGQVEIGSRWFRQDRGAHTKAGHMNDQAIGIALVGNFSKTKVSDRQLDTLVYLVKILMDEYGIPKSRVVGHRNVNGAHTACPGDLFPWTEFTALL